MDTNDITVCKIETQPLTPMSMSVTQYTCYIVTYYMYTHFVHVSMWLTVYNCNV